MLTVLDEYLEMPDEERLLYRLCRRMGRCREPNDIDIYGMRPGLEEAMDRVRAQGDPETILGEMADSMV